MRLALITDAWSPQINGVVTTLTTTTAELRRLGHEVLVLHPGLFRHMPMPGYREIPLAILPGRALTRQLEAFRPEAIHIATEGPVGLAGRRYCRRRQLPFTTAYHTNFPEYINLRTHLPVGPLYRLMRWFHGPAVRTMVSTPTVKARLESMGFSKLVFWTRGVDLEQFQPANPRGYYELPRPIAIFVGRVAVEKNLEAFLKLDLPGSKVIVGRGPDLESLRQKYPQAHFAGFQTADSLARHLAHADVFVFPSLTDTFGIVMLEAMACGLPVAAFPVQGPIDVVTQGVTGVLHEDLGIAVREALLLDPARCREHALSCTWERCTQQFLGNLAPFAGAGSGGSSGH